MYGYVYLIVNNVNGKTYIGQHKLYNKSWESDNYMGSGKLLKRAQKKYGIGNFEKFLIQYCDSQKSLDEAETFWIAEYRRRSMAQYNIANGGHGSGAVSEEIRKKLSLSHKGQKPGITGKKHTKEAKEKMSKAKAGKTSSFKGKHLPDSAKATLSSYWKGKHWKLVDGKRVWY